MALFLEFVSQNWYLFVMLAAILLLLSFDPSSRTIGGAKKISPQELPMLQHRQSAVVVDVRTADEFKSGHIEQAISLPMDNIESGLKKLNKHKTKPLILVCQSGARAGKAVGTLKNNSFDDLYVLEGGINAWSKESFPLSKA